MICTFFLEIPFPPENQFKKADFMFDDIPTEDSINLEDIQIEDLVIINTQESNFVDENVRVSWSDQFIKVDKYENQVLPFLLKLNAN